MKEGLAFEACQMDKAVLVSADELEPRWKCLKNNSQDSVKPDSPLQSSMR